ncbi:MAG TPA: YceI family protein, partial [Rhodanobacteraceae bacterium]|nr:YceI family protein [Rhodanobacteraceae bacterium]
MRFAFRAASLALAAAALLPAVASARTLGYRIDPVHTQVLFSIDHDGYSQPVGRMKVEAGWLQFDEDDWTTAKVVVDVDTASVDLGDKEWDEAVTGKRFLDAKDFPLAHFESTSVEKTDAQHGTLHGNLMLRGVTHEVAIPFTFNRAGATIFSGMQTLAGFSAQTTLDRTQFGMTAFPKAVGIQVTVRLEVEAILDQDAQKEYEAQKDST